MQIFYSRNETFSIQGYRCVLTLKNPSHSVAPMKFHTESSRAQRKIFDKEEGYFIKCRGSLQQPLSPHTTKRNFLNKN